MPECNQCTRIVAHLHPYDGTFLFCVTCLYHAKVSHATLDTSGPSSLPVWMLADPRPTPNCQACRRKTLNIQFCDGFFLCPDCLQASIKCLPPLHSELQWRICSVCKRDSTLQKRGDLFLCSTCLDLDVQGKTSRGEYPGPIKPSRPRRPRTILPFGDPRRECEQCNHLSLNVRSNGIYDLCSACYNDYEIMAARIADYK